MNLKPELLSTLVSLGVTEPEIAMLGEKMLSSVSGLQATLNALDAQIATLTAQRDEALSELARGLATVKKLGDL